MRGGALLILQISRYSFNVSLIFLFFILKFAMKPVLIS